MCCVLELVMTVFGIVILVKGTVQFTRNRQVRGAPAYIIGAILVAVLPTAFLVGIVYGIVLAIKTGAPPKVEQLQPTATIIEAAIVLVAIIAAAAIASATAKEPKRKKTTIEVGPSVNPPYRPVDPNNPYAAPQSDDRDRLLDDIQ